MLKKANHQEKILLNLLKKAERTSFGLNHKFSTIKSIQEFQTNVPIQSYESLLPYIDEAKQGTPNQLWPGIVRNFAISSGTSGVGKHIPITIDRLKADKKFHISVLKKIVSKKENWSVFAGKVLSMPGGLNEIQNDKNTYKIGEISALTADNSAKWMDYFQLYPLKKAIRLNWKDKFELLSERAQVSDIRLITGAPTWIYELLKVCKEKSGKEIKDLWPNLKVILSGGVALSHYIDQFKMLTQGLKINYLEMYGASEGYIGISDFNRPDWFNLELNQHLFYEFECLRTKEIVDLRNVKPNKEYSIRLSTNTGLWRYPLKDIVSFNDQFQLKILGRTHAMSDYFGEAVSIDEIQEILHSLNLSSKTSTIGPSDYGGINRLCIILTGLNQIPTEEMADRIDRELISRNRHYSIRRESGAMGQIELRSIPFEMLSKIVLEKSEKAQQKIPLVTQNCEIMNLIVTRYNNL